MANQKPVDRNPNRSRQGYDLAQWNRRTAEAQRHLLAALQRGRSMEEYAELRAQRLVGACESGRLSPTRASSSFRQKQNSRRFRWTSPSGQPRQGAAEPFASPRLCFSSRFN